MRWQGSNKANETDKIKRYSEKQRTSKERMRRQEKQTQGCQSNKLSVVTKIKICERQHINASTFIKQPKKQQIITRERQNPAINPHCEIIPRQQNR